MEGDADLRRLANYLNLQRQRVVGHAAWADRSRAEGGRQRRKHGLDFRDTVDFTVQLGDVQFPTRSRARLSRLKLVAADGTAEREWLADGRKAKGWSISASRAVSRGRMQRARVEGGKGSAIDAIGVLCN